MITATYTLDPRSSLPLLVDNGINVTMILYGQVAVGEYASQTAEWTSYLGDAQLSVRQLVDESGAVTQTQTYGPYGVLLHQAGDGGGLFGYKGGQSTTNGLWYFGDGYFDPQTGQFLATDGSPLLPLVAAAMANPGGLLFGPILFIHWRRRKGKKGMHPATFLLFGVLLAAGLSGCGGGGATGTPGTPIISPTSTPISIPVVTVTQVSTPTSTATVVEITAVPCPTWTPTPTPTQPPSPTPTPSLMTINIRPTGGSQYQIGKYDGTIMVNYRQDYDHIGPPPIYTPSAPNGTVKINYTAPILDLSDAEIVDSAQGGQYYRPVIWDGLHDLDLYARVVSRERASDLGNNPFDRDRIIEGLAITNVIKNRTLDPGFGGRGGYRNQILAPGQFAFTLTDPIGGDAIEGANMWANIGDSTREQEIYEHSLRYVVGVDKGWFHDPSHGALFFGGNGTSHFSYFGHEANEDSLWYEPSWP